MRPMAFLKILKGIPLTRGGDEVQGVPGQEQNPLLLLRGILAPKSSNHLLGIREHHRILHGCTAKKRNSGVTSEDERTTIGAGNNTPPPLAPPTATNATPAMTTTVPANNFSLFCLIQRTASSLAWNSNALPSASSLSLLQSR